MIFKEHKIWDLCSLLGPVSLCKTLSPSVSSIVVFNITLYPLAFPSFFVYAKLYTCDPTQLVYSAIEKFMDVRKDHIPFFPPSFFLT